MSAPYLAQTLIAAACLVGWAITIAAALAAWRGWLRLRVEQTAGPARERPVPPLPSGTMIEMADLRERVRKLEAIAEGINP